jgi:predicted N-acetyltransferase YhbS
LVWPKFIALAELAAHEGERTDMTQTANLVRAKALTLQIRNEQAKDGAAIDALVMRAFGPGRLAKTAERLREGNRPIGDLSFVAEQGGEIVGSVRLWPIQIGPERLVFLGPFAVESSLRSQGLGAQLIKTACQAAAEAEVGAILLVGDLAYFSGLGFERTDPGRILMPGPVDPGRVLIQPLAKSSDVYHGLVKPAALGPD